MAHACTHIRVVFANAALLFSLILWVRGLEVLERTAFSVCVVLQLSDWILQIMCVVEERCAAAEVIDHLLKHKTGEKIPQD